MSFLLSRRPSHPVPLAGDQPGPSILLNPDEGPNDFQPPTTARSQNGSQSIRTTHTGQDGVSPTGSATASTSSLTSSSNRSSSASAGGASTTGAAKIVPPSRPAITPTTGACSKVSFAPLPEVPPELKRRSSITLGVAARKNLLSGGNGAGRQGGQGEGLRSGGLSTICMTDEEWATYKETHFPQDKVVDVGEVAKSGAKSLWRRVRSGSFSHSDQPVSTQSSSSASTSASNSTSQGSLPVSSPRRGLIRPTRRNTAPSARTASLSPPSSPLMNTGAGSTFRLDAVVEEREKERRYSPRSLGQAASSPESRSMDKGPPGHHANFAPWANEPNDGGTAGRRTSTPPSKTNNKGVLRSPRPLTDSPEDQGSGSETEGSGHNTPTPRIKEPIPPVTRRERAARDRNSAILGFDKLALDKKFSGHFGV